MDPGYKLEKVRDITDEDIVMIIRTSGPPSSAYPTAHPPLAEQQEPNCPVRKMVTPTEGAKAEAQP